MFGLITFDHAFCIGVPLQFVTSDSQKVGIRHQVDQERWGNWGATNMYIALSGALILLGVFKEDIETWVSLTGQGNNERCYLIGTRKGCRW